MNDAVLDGTLEDFPNRQQSMHLYRLLWGTYLCTFDSDLRAQISELLDQEQQEICFGPGPLWKRFTSSLTGYDNLIAKEQHNHAT